jgi:hypothetical protein
MFRDAVALKHSVFVRGVLISLELCGLELGLEG